MNRITLTIAGLLLIASCVWLMSMISPALQTEAETRHTEAQVELIESETSQESQRALSNIIDVLLAELRAEREQSDRIQREQFQLLVELAEELRQPNYTWLWVMLIVVSGIAIVLLLRRHERIVVVMLPPGVPNPWLPVGSTDVVPWEKQQDTIQVMQIPQERQEIIVE